MQTKNLILTLGLLLSLTLGGRTSHAQSIPVAALPPNMTSLVQLPQGSFQQPAAGTKIYDTKVSFGTGADRGILRTYVIKRADTGTLDFYYLITPTTRYLDETGYYFANWEPASFVLNFHTTSPQTYWAANSNAFNYDATVYAWQPTQGTVQFVDAAVELDSKPSPHPRPTNPGLSSFSLRHYTLLVRTTSKTLNTTGTTLTIQGGDLLRLDGSRQELDHPYFSLSNQPGPKY